ncbi:hypothetical protein Mpt1_c13390 [Candidatus Methanoplasma termitum]|uniref:UPF0235 protein Mpt1_c13390 n=1 Tax=Candidatus Methanoplasma termitum TaxID=1577791 RepID=A0A0A7LI75_9ARCH|nr:DUF167 domain-containing protein [Candidatus Methanoplasma termitum]AIZ57201.1 hypothetical protein Mpt1_c13390 [Candidatus Methanoplasma termitum]MCL2334177.1 DUF167 domain-containing protein [Candidatus Methanoplasma sp.]
MPIEDVIRIKGSGVEADVLVSPGSSRHGIEGIDGWRKRLTVKVTAPPLDGKANAEVEELFSEVTGAPSSILSGHTSRQKTVFIKGDPVMIVSKLRGQVE